MAEHASLVNDATVTVLFFAALRDLVGAAERRLSLPAGGYELAELRGVLERVVPELRGRFEQVRIAHNEVFADEHLELKAGDVIALIPPVSGG